MIRLVVVLSLFIVGCSNHGRPVINGFSTHLAKPSDRTNPGIGIRTPNGYEVGVYDNSRIYRSYSYYLQRRVIKANPLFVDLGVAYYDSGSVGAYDKKLNPIISSGVRFKYAEVGYAVPDILYMRFPL